MSKRETKREGYFNATNEAGNIFKIWKFVTYVIMRDSEGETREKNSTRLQTDEGYQVNHLGKGEYQIVETDEILRSDDPSAP